MIKFVVATCIVADDKKQKVKDLVISTFGNGEDTVILDLNSINSETLQKYINHGAIDCFVISSDTIMDEKGREIIKATLINNVLHGHRTNFINVYDKTDEKDTMRSSRIGELLLNERYGTSYLQLDVNGNLESMIRNCQNIKTGSITHRKYMHEQDQQLFDLITMAIDRIEKGKDEYTAKHIRSVCVIAEEIAKRMGLSYRDITILKAGALLHDIGKKDISDDILKKSSRLTDEEFSRIKEHVVYGEVDLNRFNFGSFERAKAIVAEHHERYDGTGYPRSLKGEQIDILSRIVSLADSTQAMFGRSYQSPRKKEDLIAELHRCEKTQFDPKVVSCLCDILENSPESICVTYGEDGTIHYDVPSTTEIIDNVKDSDNEVPILSL